jgi:hypothetical protein
MGLLKRPRIAGVRRPIGAMMHGVTDYTVGAALVGAVPRLLGVQGTPASRHIRAAGTMHLAYSVLTDYPLGVVRKLPYRAHLAMDTAGAVGLGLAPFITGSFRLGRRQWMPQVALALFELTAVALSDPTGRGFAPADSQAEGTRGEGVHWAGDPVRAAMERDPAMPTGQAG